MKIKNPIQFYIGILIIVLLIISAFINLQRESGADYVVYTKLLGILIFYNPIVLAVYVLIALFLIYKGIGKKIRFA